MLQEFTQDDRLREQYRLHQEWLREQRTIDAERRKTAEEYRKTAEEYRKTAEELAAERNLRKKAEAELKERERCSVLALKKAG